MGGRNNNYFGSEELIHPDAPGGGTGRGYSYNVQDTRGYREASEPHPSSPAARTWDWFALPEIDLLERLECLQEAIDIAFSKAGDAIVEETGEELKDILHSVIPSIQLCLIVVVSTTVLGGVIGAAVGSLALGWGAVPSGIFGAKLGAESGVLLLEGLGLTVIAGVILKHLGHCLSLAADGVSEAWHAIDRPQDRWSHVHHAGETLARAVGVFMRAVLQGVVAWLLNQGAKAAAKRVPALAAELRRFSAEFAAWIERNWARLLENPKLREQDGIKLQDGELPPTNESVPPPKEQAPKTQEQQPKEKKSVDKPRPKREPQNVDKKAVPYKNQTRQRKNRLNRKRIEGVEEIEGQPGADDLQAANREAALAENIKQKPGVEKVKIGNSAEKFQMEQRDARIAELKESGDLEGAKKLEGDNTNVDAVGVTDKGTFHHGEAKGKAELEKGVSQLQTAGDRAGPGKVESNTLYTTESLDANSIYEVNEAGQLTQGGELVRAGGKPIDVVFTTQ